MTASDEHRRCSRLRTDLHWYEVLLALRLGSLNVLRQLYMSGKVSNDAVRVLTLSDSRCAAAVVLDMLVRQNCEAAQSTVDIASASVV